MTKESQCVIHIYSLQNHKDSLWHSVPVCVWDWTSSVFSLSLKLNSFFFDWLLFTLKSREWIMQICTIRLSTSLYTSQENWTINYDQSLTMFRSTFAGRLAYRCDLNLSSNSATQEPLPSYHVPVWVTWCLCALILSRVASADSTACCNLIKFFCLSGLFFLVVTPHMPDHTPRCFAVQMCQYWHRARLNSCISSNNSSGYSVIQRHDMRSSRHHALISAYICDWVAICTSI